MGDLSGRYECITDLFLYIEGIVVGDIVNIISEKIIKMDLPDGYHQHYIDGYYNSWVSEDDIKYHFKSLTDIRKEKIKQLLK